MISRRLSGQHGFTLLEVLVALAIVAIALGAIIKAAAASAHNVAYLRDRTLASWVALNQINQILLSKDWPAKDSSSSGKAEMAGREWRWELRVSDTSDKDLRRLELAVRALEGGELLTTLIAFKGNPEDSGDPEGSNNPEDSSTPEDSGRESNTAKNSSTSRAGSTSGTTGNPRSGRASRRNSPRD